MKENLNRLNKIGAIIPKFNIGDRVISKKTGMPASGVISGIVLSDHIPNVYSENHPWNKYYDDWREKLCYYILLSNPQRNVSLEEFKLSIKEKFEHEHDIEENMEKIQESEWIMHYENSIKVVRSASYPEDDLELF